MTVPKAFGRQSIPWLLVSLIIVVLAVAQFWVGARVKTRTLDLRHSLDSTYDAALELTQVLGYGGLIHHFKNFLLRPDQPQYLEAGIEDAMVADELVRRLEEAAGELGFDTTLTNTRAMIAGYLERIERISMLTNSGLSTQQMDKVLKLDDQFAIEEVGNLLEQLSGAVTAQVENIENQGRMLNLVSLAGTTALSVLILTMFMQRRHRNAYVRSIDTLNRQLAASNACLTMANTSLKQFAGIVSHDLKTPLRHISLFNEQILEDIDDRGAVRSHVDTIRSSVERMTDLISSLLDFTRSGFTHPERELVDIRPLIMDVVSEFQIVIDEKQANVTVHADGQVMADALLLRRVLQNLLDNSLKYIKDEQIPQVSIVAKHLEGSAAGTVQITVSDNGIGIPGEHVERVFEPLERLHTDQNRFSGTGIGLSLAKTVVNAHGGHIEVADDYRGGTQICVTLPGDTQHSTS